MLKKLLSLHSVFFLLLSFVFTNTVFAAAEEQGLGSLMDMSLNDLLKISVSSTLKEQKTRDVPGSVTVITAAEIKIKGYSSIKEVLMDVPGFNDVADSNEVIGAVRGAYTSTTNKVLTLVNGHRMNELFLGRYNLDQFLGMDAIERIEFIRGPVSVMWGTGAVIGVVNIITKKGSAINGTYAKIRAGKETLRPSIISGTKVGDYDVMTTFTYLDQKGKVVPMPADQNIVYNGTQPSGAIYDGRYQKNWAGMVTLDNGDSTLMMRAERYARVNPRGVTGRYYTIGNEVYLPEYEQDDFFFDYEYRFKFEAPFSQSLSIRPSFHWIKLREISWITVGADDEPPYGTRAGQQSQQQLTQLKLTYKADVLPSLNVTLGTDFLYANFFMSDLVSVNGTSEYSLTRRYDEPGDQFQSAYYTQAIWSTPVEGLTVTGGLRFDAFHYCDKTALTTRLATVYHFLGDWTAKFAYGRSFLAPTRDHTDSGNPSFSGNPNLEAEVNDGIDIIFMLEKEKYDLTFNFFSNWATGLITSINNTYENQGRLAYRGFELEGSYRILKMLNVNGSYSFVDAHDTETTSNLTGKYITGIAPHTFRLGITVEPISNLTFALTSRTTSSVRANDSLSPTGVSVIPPTSLLDLSAIYEYSSWDFQLIARNVLNRKYTIANIAKARPMAYGGAWVSGQVGYNF
jgi:outer membrane receptor protein involved in Fe transport